MLIDRQGALEGKLVGLKDFTCETPEVCERIDAALASEEDFVITFAYGEPVEDVIIAIDVLDAEGDPITVPIPAADEETP